MTTEERLNELEIRYAHQHRLLEEMDQELIASAQRLGKLERELQQLVQTLQRSAPELLESPDE
jgi:SlyX protein